MSLQLSQLPVFYLPQVQQSLQESGVNIASWLKTAGLDAKQISNPDALIPINKYLSLINSAVTMSQQPDIGLRVGRKLNIGSHGLLGFSLLTCHDLAQALDLLERFLCTRTPLLKVYIEELPEQVKLKINVPNYVGNVYRSFVETSMLSIFNLLCYLTPGQTTVTRIEFDYPPPDYEEAYDETFSCEKRFSAAENCLIISPSALHRHFATDDPFALREAKKAFEEQKLALQALSWENNVSEKIYNLLYRERHSFPDLEEIAASLCITSRTLHRRLVAEGTSYRQVLHGVKAKLARQYLASSMHTVAEISDLLGYDNVANFRRAFKQWEGGTPQQFRLDVHNSSVSKGS